MMSCAPISARIKNTLLQDGDDPEDKDQVARSLTDSDIDPLKMTTMRVCNLPRRCMQDRFIALLDSYGFEGTYDFVYVPYCIEKRKNRGYGFVNFLDAENGKRLRSLWNLQQVFPAVHSTQPTKAITVGFAVIQGAEENVRALLDKNNPPTFYRAVQPARTTSSSWMGWMGL